MLARLTAVNLKVKEIGEDYRVLHERFCDRIFVRHDRRLIWLTLALYRYFLENRPFPQVIERHFVKLKTRSMISSPKTSGALDFSPRAPRSSTWREKTALRSD